MLIKITRQDHAAHCFFGGDVLHDLENFHVRSAFNAPRCAGVPADAKRSYGYMLDGAQVVVWTRTLRARNANCSKCQAKGAAA